MSHLTKFIAIDGAEYLKVYQKFRYISRCLSTVRCIEPNMGLSRHTGYHRQLSGSSSSGALLFASSQCARKRATPTVLSRQSIRLYSDLPPHTVIVLPALSPTMESGSIVAWDKREGDEIAEGDVLCEVETDKATMGFEASEPGVLAKILVPAGTKGLPLGSPVCVVVASRDQVAAFADFKADGAAKPAASAPAAAASAAAAPAAAAPAAPVSAISSSSNLPPHVAITLPALSPTMEQGTIVSWEKKEGDYVKEGDLLAEIETDKATMGFEASEEGYLARILVPAGSKNIPLGSVLCVLVASESDAPKFAQVTAADLGGGAPKAAAPASQASPPPPPPPPPPPSPQQSQPQAAQAKPAGDGGFIKASPYARLLSREKGIPLASVATASGADGRIVSADVLNAAAAAGVSSTPKTAAAAPTAATAAAARPTKTPAAAAAAAGADYVDIPLTSMRSTIAKRLTQAKQTIPHYYLTVQVTMDAVLKVRQSLNKQLEGKAAKLSVNDFVIKAAAVALGRVPECNSAWFDTYIRQYSRADISVAVATENGLITPIVFNADAKGLLGINSDVVRLAEKARTNKLRPQEFQGGSFTISNLGMFGIQSFSAIINPPQACILAVGGAEKILVPSSDKEKGFATSTVMRVTLCCDHRVVDGAVGAKWLAEFKSCLEDPYNMLL